MSIYVTDDLKERMEAVDANWSAVAQSAFDLEIRSTGTGGYDMEAVIERLRASKEKKEQAERPEWVQKGREWAMHVAEYDELDRVASLSRNKEFQSQHLQRFDTDNDKSVVLLRMISMSILDRNVADNELVGLAEKLFGRANATYNQMHWWLAGANEIWKKVEGKV